MSMSNYSLFSCFRLLINISQKNTKKKTHEKQIFFTGLVEIAHSKKSACVITVTTPDNWD